MLTNLKEMLAHAWNNHYAVGSFNAYNYETIKGILDGAAALKRPVIVALGARYLDNMGLSCAHGLVRSLAQDLDIPVCLHLDHCSDMAVVYQAIRAGFDSVMYDGSALPFAENLCNTAAVCAVAHSCGVSVEAELGCLAAGEGSHEGRADDREAYTDPLAAKRFIEETGADALAVSIGTVHGLYRGKPNIRVDILKEINDRLGIPLVLHGGSGTPEDAIRACIGNGIAKINVNTETSTYTIERTAAMLVDKKPHFSVVSLKQQGFVAEVVRKYIQFFDNGYEG